MARTGRPPKDKGLLHNVPVRFMVTAEQKQLFDQAIALEREELSSWARAVLLKEAGRIVARDRKTGQARSGSEGS